MNDNLMHLIAVAAYLRAIGLEWETIADNVGRSPETCRQWPIRFEREWQTCYRHAEATVISAAASEARGCLRMLTRSENVRVACSAAQTLLKLHHEQLRDERRQRRSPSENNAGGDDGDISSQALRSAKLVASLSNTERRLLVRHVHAKEAAASESSANQDKGAAGNQQSLPTAVDNSQTNETS
jgi:hypothetical protein